MSRDRFPCGCVADARRWLQLCPAHQAEHDDMHAAALAGFAEQREPGRDVDDRRQEP